jgi:membrane-bound serine protease (ClpP class)
MKSRFAIIVNSLAFVLLLFAGIFSINYANTTAVTKQSQAKVILLDVSGAIGPASQDYIIRGINKAKETGAALVVIRLDTPGGLDLSMRMIIRQIIASPIPIATYVSPSGARAASAGTYILYASHIAAMAPGTNLGAATPVSLISAGSGENKKQTEKSAMEKKVENDASAYIRSLAQLRGRNIQWAQRAVLQGESLSATEALQLGVIDVIANNLNDLFQKINGHVVIVQGQKQTLQLSNVIVERFSPDWRVRFLEVITDPNIAYILLLVGVYGLFFEFMNPGMVLPGVAGIIALLIALYAFQLLPINYVGLGLILLGIAFMIAEAFIASFGTLAVGGIIAFILGSVMLFDSNTPGYGIMLPLIIAVALVSIALVLLIVQLALRSHRRPIVSGKEELIGSIGNVVLMKGDERLPRLRVRGELWQIHCDQPLHDGQKVKIIAIDGLVLTVQPLEGSEPSSEGKRLPRNVK